jgi:WhiB family transcriptional regulator, redox-sensing transcriptional regulator
LEWLQQAACKGKTGSFFSKHPNDLAFARELCASCPVRDECFEHAMSDLNLHGVWAGLTSEQRRELRWGSAVA